MNFSLYTAHVKSASVPTKIHVFSKPQCEIKPSGNADCHVLRHFHFGGH